jgi:ABC-type nitrate/sulfonate/bicarbonate transport system substrate-binding protein
MKKTVLIMLTIGLILAAITSCKKADKSLTPITVILDWTPNTNHTGLYVALEKGWYKEQGLDVHIVQPGQGFTDQIVATGKSQFGISYQENVTRARNENLPLVSIAAVIQHNTSGFASLKETGIISVKDFEGKRYGSWDSPSELAVLQATMQKSGADYSKVKVISGITDFFSTIGRDADFEWIYEGWDGQEAKLRKMELNYIALKDLEPALDYYTPVIITNEALIKANPELISKFMKATAAGYEFAIANPDEAASILLKHAPELKPELVRASQQYLSDKYQADAVQWGAQKFEVWQNYASWMVTQKLLPPNIDVTSAYTNRFLPLADK